MYIACPSELQGEKSIDPDPDATEKYKRWFLVSGREARCSYYCDVEYCKWGWGKSMYESTENIDLIHVV